MKFNQLSIITTVLLITILAPLATSQTPPNPKYLGPSDTGVSYYPKFENLKMHIRCYSNSSIVNGKTLILDSGLPWFGSAFAKVIELLIPKMSTYGISKVCVFDRYGMGFSDSSPSGTIQGFELARKLKNSLDRIGLCPPYIYGGWSWGGLDAQFFALLYPNQVQGLLLIESSDRYLSTDLEYQSYIPSFLTEINNFISLNNNNTLRAEANDGFVGIIFGYPPNDTPIPANAINITQEIFLAPSNKYLTASYHEVNSMVATSTLLDAAYNSSSSPSTPLGNIPTVVLYSNAGQPSWITRQNKLKNLTSNGEVHGLNDTLHMVVFDNPQAIVDQIQNLITRIANTPIIHTFTCVTSTSTTTGPSQTITTTGSSTISSSSSGTVTTSSTSSISTGSGYSTSTSSSTITTTSSSGSSTSTSSTTSSTSTGSTSSTSSSTSG